MVLKGVTMFARRPPAVPNVFYLTLTGSRAQPRTLDVRALLALS